MESDEEIKKLTDDVMVFISKCSKTDAARYTARLKTYVDLQRKRHRAAAARRHSDLRRGSSNRKTDADQKEKAADNTGMVACLGMMVARISAFVGTNIVGGAMTQHCSTALYSAAAIVLSGAVAALFLPPDRLWR